MNNSGSADCTVRLWSIGGRYISTLGTFRDWVTILPTLPVQKYFEDYKLPTDIKGLASFTTLKVNLRNVHGNVQCVSFGYDAKVLRGGMRQVPIEIEEEEIEIPKEILEEERHMLYGKELHSSVLENYHKSQLPEKTYQKCLRLDTTFPYVSTCTYMLYIKIFIL